MIQIKTRQELEAFKADLTGTVGFVPTMGALHEGHKSLILNSISSCDTTIVSIFVNPTQFAPSEDFAQYPRIIDEDLKLCENLGVQAVFTPNETTVYPNQDHTARYKPEKALAEILCGKSRPHFFYGVCNVVERLFGLIEPTHAFFGEKDLQQMVIIQNMVKDLELNITVVGCPIIRDENGLALSSRNAYLDEAGYQKALNLSRALHDIRLHVRKNNWSVQRVRQFLAAELEGRGLKGDYVDVFRPTTGCLIRTDILPGDHCCVAVYVDNIRLIDNIKF